MNLTTRSGHINSLAVANPVMSVPAHVNAVVRDVIIGEQATARHHVFLDEPVQSRLLGVGCDPRNHTSSLALDRPDHRRFRFLGCMNAFDATAYVHLVNFYRCRSLQLSIFGKQAANLLEHSPRAFVGDSGLALNLLCRYAATSRTHQVHGVEPSAQRSAALLEDGSGEWVDVLSAVVAGIRSAASDVMMLAQFTRAFFGIAFHHATGETHFHDAVETGVITGKFFAELLDGVTKFFRDALADFHGFLFRMTITKQTMATNASTSNLLRNMSSTWDDQSMPKILPYLLLVVKG